MITPEELDAATIAYTGQSDPGLTASVLRRLAARQAAAGKTCAICRLEKPLAAFGRDSRNRDGLHRICRQCRSEQVS